MTEFVTLGSIIETLLASCRKDTCRGLAEILRVWKEAVGEAVALNARPEAIKGKSLLVHVSSSAWMQQLRFLEKEMIRKRNEAAGPDLVREIRFKIGSVH
jgi:predicted nucleic acid-binding Zn ribbon protein